MQLLNCKKAETERSEDEEEVHCLCNMTSNYWPHWRTSERWEAYCKRGGTKQIASNSGYRPRSRQQTSPFANVMWPGDKSFLSQGFLRTQFFLFVCALESLETKLKRRHLVKHVVLILVSMRYHMNISKSHKWQLCTQKTSILLA